MAALAPTAIQSTQASSTASLSLAGLGANVGDLLVIVQEGTNATSGTTSPPTLQGVTSGVQQDLIQTAGGTSGNGRLIYWSKVLVAGDPTTNVQVSLTGFVVHRAQCYIVPATEGWDGSRVAQAIQSSTNGTASLALDGQPRAPLHRDRGRRVRIRLRRLAVHVGRHHHP